MGNSPIIITVVCIVILVMLMYYMNISNETTVYRFYRPSCRYCVESQPEWNKFKMHICNSMNIKIVEVNLDDGGPSISLAKKFDVKSVPTVFKILPNGERVDHKGPRTMAGYISFVN